MAWLIKPPDNVLRYEPLRPPTFIVGDLVKIVGRTDGIYTVEKIVPITGSIVKADVISPQYVEILDMHQCVYVPVGDNDVVRYDYEVRRIIRCDGDKAYKPRSPRPVQVYVYQLESYTAWMTRQKTELDKRTRLLQAQEDLTEEFKNNPW